MYKGIEALRHEHPMPALHVHLPAQFYMFLLSPTDSCRCWNIKNRVYIYTEHLLGLSQWASPTHYCLATPPMRAGSNPSVSIRQSFMVSHPDKRFVNYILQGLTLGFRIGFNPKAVILQSSSTNHQSVTANSITVTDYISAEQALGRVNGPFPPAQLAGIHTSLIPQATPTRQMASDRGHVLPRGS